MYVAAAGDIVRATLAVMYADTQLEETNLGLKCITPGAAAANYLTLLATQVYNVVHAAMGPSTPSNATFLGCKTSVELPHPGPTPGLFNVSVVGGGTANSAPTQARPILRLRTDLVGPKFRGRMFLFTPDSMNVTAAGFPGAGLLTAINALGVSILGPYSPTAGAVWVPAVIHRVTLTNPVLFSSQITSAAAAPGFGTQRRSGNTGKVNVAPW